MKYFYIVFLVLQVEKGASKDVVLFTTLDEYQIKKNNQITTLPTLGYTYSISFQIMANAKYDNAKSSIIRFLKFNSETEQEKTIMELFLQNESFKLDFYDIYKNLFKESVLISSEDLMNKWSKITISQVIIEKEYVLTVTLNDKVVLKISVLTPVDNLLDVEVYATKSENPFPGSIRNIKIESDIGDKAPCECSMEKIKKCLSLKKEDIINEINKKKKGKKGKKVTCYSDKLLEAIQYLEDEMKHLNIEEKKMKSCQMKLKRYLSIFPDFIYSYDKCVINIFYHLKRLQSSLHIKINELINEYEYEELMFGDITKISY